MSSFFKHHDFPPNLSSENILISPIDLLNDIHYHLIIIIHSGVRYET